MNPFWSSLFSSHPHRHDPPTHFCSLLLFSCHSLICVVIPNYILSSSYPHFLLVRPPFYDTLRHSLHLSSFPGNLQLHNPKSDSHPQGFCGRKTMLRKSHGVFKFRQSYVSIRLDEGTYHPGHPPLLLPLFSAILVRSPLFLFLMPVLNIHTFAFCFRW